LKIQIKNNHLIVFESVLFKTTTSLLIGSDALILVDPNWLPSEIEFISTYINDTKGNKKLYLYFTHSDYDHIIGYGAFKAYETIASHNFVSNSKKQDILSQINAFDDSYYITRPYAIEYPDIKHVISEDGQTLMLGNQKFIFWLAVGHNPDGLLLLDPTHNVLVVGDYMSNVEFPYIYASIKEYKSTLMKIENIVSKFNVKYLISGHGDHTSSNVEIEKRLSDSRSYIEQLEVSVSNNVPFDFDNLMKNYNFPIVMKQFHEGNIKLAKKELETKDQ